MTSSIGRRVAAVGLAVLLCVAAGSGYIYYCDSVYDQMTPDPSVDSLHRFLDTMPLPEQVFELELEGRAYTLLVGARPSTLVLPSGPPVYVFDEACQLVDWTLDIDEDAAFEQRWWLQGERSEVPVIELLERTEDVQEMVPSLPSSSSG